MYNGIGLSTVRGSGTNGYVQRNTAHISKGRAEEKFKTEDDIRFGSIFMLDNHNVRLVTPMFLGGWTLKRTESPTLVSLSMRGKGSWR